MEDLLQQQDALNTEYKQRKRAELRTPEGMKKFIAERSQKFVHNLMTKKHYSYPFIIVLLYVLGSGTIYLFSNLFELQTAVLVTVCILVIYWSNIKQIYLKIKSNFNVFFKRNTKK